MKNKLIKTRLLIAVVVELSSISDNKTVGLII
jgi:hypothetical protein